jgi:hypothetical protein
LLILHQLNKLGSKVETKLVGLERSTATASKGSALLLFTKTSLQKQKFDGDHYNCLYEQHRQHGTRVMLDTIEYLYSLVPEQLQQELDFDAVEKQEKSH